MSLISAISGMSISIRLVSLLASVAVHAAVLMTIPMPIGETGTGPAQSKSAMHVSVERAELADTSPEESYALEPMVQEQAKTESASDQIEPPAKALETPVIEELASNPKPAIIQAKVSKQAIQPKQDQVEPPAKTRNKAPQKKIEPKKEAKTLAKPKPKAAPAVNLAGTPSSEHKGAKAKMVKPVQVATAGKQSNPSRDYRSTLLRLIERNKYYPLRARRSGMEGKASVSFVVSRNGSIDGIKITQSSGKSLLDRAAIKTIQRVGVAPPLPKEIKQSKWKFVVPITYEIR